MKENRIPIIVAVVTLALVLLFAFSGCNKKNQEELKQKEIKNDTDKILELCGSNLMEAIYRSNRLDSLLMDYENVSQRTDFYNEQGVCIYSFWSYADRNIFYMVDNADCKIIYYNGMCYQYTPDSSEPYVDKIKPGVTLKACQKRRDNMIYTPLAEEELLGSAQHGEEYVVTTRIPAGSIKGLLCESHKRNAFQEYLKTFDLDDNCIVEYYLTPFLYEIKNLNLYVIKSDGTKYRFIKTNVTLDGNRPEEVVNFVN